MALKVADLLVVITADPKGFEEATKRIGQNVQKLGKQMESAGRQMTMKVSLPMMAIGGAAGKMAMDFDDATNRMVSLVGINRDQVNGWKDDMHGLAKETGRTSTELGEAMFFITSAGLRGDTAMAALDASARAAAIGMGETKDIAFAAASAVNAYGLSSEDTELAVAQLMMTVREGNLEASSLAPVMGMILPVAAELGVGLDQLGGSIAAMTRLGADAGMSATALRQVMSTLMKPTKMASDTLEEVGLSAGALREQVREKGLFSVLMTLKDAFIGNEEAMARVFPNIRALTGVLNLAGKNAETTDRILKNLAATTVDDLGAAFKEAGMSSKVQFQMSLAELQTSLIKLGQEILPPFLDGLRAVAELVTKGSEALEQMDPWMKQLVLGFGGLLIALGPALTILGMMTKNIGFLIVQMNLLRTATASNTVTDIQWIAITRQKNMLFQTSTQGMIAMKAGTVALGLSIGYLIGSAIRPYVEELIGLSDAQFKVANQFKDVAAVWAKDSEQFNTNLMNYNKMREALKLTGDQWLITADHTKENALRLAELLPKVEQMARAKREEARATEDSNVQSETMRSTQERIMEQFRRKEAEQSSYLEKLREEYDILTREDVLNQLAEHTKAYQTMKDLKISDAQIQDQLGDKLSEDLDLLKQYKEPLSALPEETKKMLLNMQEAVPSLQSQIAELGNLGNQYESLAQQIAVTITDPNTGLAKQAGDALSGGFGEGIERGVAYGKQALVNMIEEATGLEIPITVVVDDARFQRWINDLIDGKIPPGGGVVP